MNPTININWVPGITLEEMEKQCVLSAYRFYRQNKTQTAGALGIAIRTLDAKLEKYGDDERREAERVDGDKRNKEIILARMRGLPHLAIDNRSPLVKLADAKIQNEATQTPAPRLETSSGERVQSLEKVTPQQPMSVPERSEVQEVLPRKVTSRSKQRRGKQL